MKCPWTALEWFQQIMAFQPHDELGFCFSVLFVSKLSLRLTGGALIPVIDLNASLSGESSVITGLSCMMYVPSFREFAVQIR